MLGKKAFTKYSITVIKHAFKLCQLPYVKIYKLFIKACKVFLLFFYPIDCPIFSCAMTVVNVSQSKPNKPKVKIEVVSTKLLETVTISHAKLTTDQKKYILASMCCVIYY